MIIRSETWKDRWLVSLLTSWLAMLWLLWPMQRSILIDLLRFWSGQMYCCTCQAPAEERGALQDRASHGSEPLEADQRGGQADLVLRGGSGCSGQTADHAGGPFSGLGHGGLSCHWLLHIINGFEYCKDYTTLTLTLRYFARRIVTFTLLISLKRSK